MSGLDRIARALREWKSTVSADAQVCVAELRVSSPYEDRSVSVELYELQADDLVRTLRHARGAHTGESLAEGDELREAAERLTYLSNPLAPTRGTRLDNPLVAAEGVRRVEQLLENVASFADDHLYTMAAEVRTGRVRRRTAGAYDADALAASFEGAAETVRSVLGGHVLPPLREAGEHLAALGRSEQLAYVDLPGDGATMTKNLIVLHYRVGIHGPGRFHVRLFEPGGGQRPVVVLSELADHHSESLENCWERVAADLAALLGIGRASDAWWVTAPALEYHRSGGDIFNEIRRRGLTDDWQPEGAMSTLSHGELEQLAGSSVRRWHVYDYTTAAVLADGAREHVIERASSPSRPAETFVGAGETRPTLWGRLRGIAAPPPPRTEASEGPDFAERTVNAVDFDDTVLLVEGLIAALDARRPQERFSATLEQLVDLRDRLIKSGDVTAEARAWSGHEWESDLRYLFSTGTDPRFEGRR